MGRQTLNAPAAVEHAFRSVRFVMGQEGQETGVLLEIEDWQVLLDWMEDLEDRALVQSVLPRLKRGPERAGTLRWEEVEADWDDESA
jgi:hypothetical protein